MRVVTNQKFIQRYRQLTQVLFFLCMGGIFFSLFFGNRISSNQTFAFYFQCLVAPALFVVVLYYVRLTNVWLRKPSPWEALQEGLKGIGSDNVLYHYVMPAHHVLVGPDGIFAMVTRFQDRPQKVVDDKWQPAGNWMTRLAVLIRQEQVGDPSYEAKLRASQTQLFLQELLQDQSIQVQPLVVFVHPRANITVEGNPTVPVLYADADKKKDSLKAYLKGLKKQGFPTLTKEQVAELDDVLLYAD